MQGNLFHCTFKPITFMNCCLFYSIQFYPSLCLISKLNSNTVQFQSGCLLKLSAEEVLMKMHACFPSTLHALQSHTCRVSIFTHKHTMRSETWEAHTSPSHVCDSVTAKTAHKSHITAVVLLKCIFVWVYVRYWRTFPQDYTTQHPPLHQRVLLIDWIRARALTLPVT